MKNKLLGFFGTTLLLTVAALTGVFLADANETAAQAKAGYEYGYLLPVESIESFDIDRDRWAAPEEDKQYLATHVFVYEQGRSNHTNHLNSLKALNELAGEGWEMVDAEVGLIRRAK